MRRLLKLSVFIGLFFVILTSAAIAHEGEDHSTSNSDSEKKFKQFRSPEAKDSSKSANKEKLNKEKTMDAMSDKKTTSTAAKKVRLSEARLKICKGKEDAIGGRFKNLLTLGEKTHTGMDKIVERVDKFYNNILVPAGYTLSNYDVLKSDMATKQTAVQAALAEAQASGQAFSCDSEDPKGEADAFRQDMQVLITANKAYKTSVRTFVTAVRDLAKEAKADKLSPSPAVSPNAVEAQ